MPAGEAPLHAEQIAGAVDAKLTELPGRYDRVFVAYADCGTAGALDVVLDRHGVERLPGAHCYGFLAGNDAWDAMQEDEAGTFYLTDFLARHFESLIVRPFKLDIHPELVPMVFGNYKRLIYLAQTDDAALRERAEAAAAFLGLAYEQRRTGYGELEPSLVHCGCGVRRSSRRRAKGWSFLTRGATPEQLGVAPKSVRCSSLTRGGATPEQHSA